MIPEILPQETWDVIDSTKLQEYMTCPRAYFFRYILGWNSASPNLDLIMGSAWHAAMDYLFRNGLSEVNLPGAQAAFLRVWNAAWAGWEAPLEGAKTTTNAFLALSQFIQRQARFFADYEVTHIETPGSVPVSESKSMYLRMDLVMQDAQKQYLVLDHKTSGSQSKFWDKQWLLSAQLGTYIHCLNCLIGPENVEGAMVVGAFFRNPPRLKQDGTPYANAGMGNEFIRVPVKKTPDQMQQWLDMVGYYMESIQMDMEILDCADGSSPTLTCFVQNTTNCTKWGRLCPYHTYCHLRANPLSFVEQWGGAPPPQTDGIQFVLRHWDPRVGPVYETKEG